MFARNLIPNATTWLPQQLFSDVLASFWLQTACPVTREKLTGGHYRQPLRLLYRRQRGEPHLRTEGAELPS